MEHDKINVKNTIILYCYRYIYKMKDGRLIVKFMTEPQESHAKFQEFIRGNPDVVSCMREYVHEINFEYLGFTEPVKIEEKENEENEKNS